MDPQSQIRILADTIIYCPKRATCFGFFTKPLSGTSTNVQGKTSLFL